MGVSERAVTSSMGIRVSVAVSIGNLALSITRACPSITSTGSDAGDVSNCVCKGICLKGARSSQGPEKRRKPASATRPTAWPASRAALLLPLIHTTVVSFALPIGRIASLRLRHPAVPSQPGSAAWRWLPPPWRLVATGRHPCKLRHQRACPLERTPFADGEPDAMSPAPHFTRPCSRSQSQATVRPWSQKRTSPRWSSTANQ